MQCPNCKAQMTEKSVNNQTVLHCTRCGGSFFEENGINRISFDSAVSLSADKQSDEISGEEKHCPKDDEPLKIIRDENTVPQNITLLRCEKCKGVFCFSDDLVKFKEAESAKINYLKTWNIPLPSLQNVLIFGFALLFSLGLFGGYSLYMRESVQQSQAQDLIKKTVISNKGAYLFISFSTMIPVKSRIEFTDATTGKVYKNTLSSSFSSIHYLTTTELNLKHTIEYRIILTDQSGNTTQTKWQIMKVAE